jgi:hypothetical protein
MKAKSNFAIRLVKGVIPNATWDGIKYLVVPAAGAALVALAAFFVHHPYIRLVAVGVLLTGIAFCVGFWLSSRKAAIIIQGQDAIFLKTQELMTSSKTSIKVMLMGNSPPAPPEFGRMLSQHLKDNQSISFHGIIVVEKTDADFWKRNDDRLASYRELGVANRMFLWIVKNPQPMGFDVVIIDDKHVQLAFSPISATSIARDTAILLCNTPELARCLSMWFTAEFKGKTSYAEARRE